MVLVTGANGFIGRAVCKRLEELSIDYIPVTREIADMSEYCNLQNILAKQYGVNCIDSVIHLAWAGTAGEARSNPVIQLGNVHNTLDLIDVSAAMGCKRFVNAHSIMAYEMNNMTSTKPVSAIYAYAKETANKMGEVKANAYGMIFSSALISNVYGPGETSPRLINTTIRKLLANEVPSFGPAERFYDFCYIDDAADLLVKVALDGDDRIYYVGSAGDFFDPRPLKLFLQEIQELIAPDVPLGIGKFPDDGAFLTFEEFPLFGGSTLGWALRVSFAEGIKRTAEWIKNEDNISN